MINIEKEEDVSFKCISKKKDLTGRNLIDEINLFKEVLKNQNIINSYKVFTVISNIKLMGFEQMMEVEMLAIFDERIKDIQFKSVEDCKLVDKNFNKILSAKYIGNPHGIQMFHQSIQQEVEKRDYKLISPPYNIFNDPNDLTNGNKSEFNMEMFFEIE